MDFDNLEFESNFDKIAVDQYLSSDEGRIETLVSNMQADGIVASTTISNDQRQRDESGILLHRFNSMVIGGATLSSSTTTYSSCSSGPTWTSLMASDNDCYYGTLPKVMIDDLRRIAEMMKFSGELSEDNDCYYGTLPKVMIDDIRHTAEKMKSTGKLFKCVTNYAVYRKVFLVTSFQRLSIEKLSVTEVLRGFGWDALETKIKLWTRAAKIFIRILFASERRQSEQIFGGLETGMDDACFAETVRDAATHLFDIAESLSMIRPSPERLETILLFHKDLSDLMPDVSYVFRSEKSVEIIQIRETIQIRAAQILSRLGDAVRVIVPAFENSVLHELSTTPVPGGNIHTLTKYVMDHVSLIVENKEILTELILVKPSTNLLEDVMIPDVEQVQVEGRTHPLALHLIWIIVILRFKLEGKSKFYAKASLAHLFMMNNVNYIVQAIKGSPELQEIIGDDYLKKLAHDVQHAATSYQNLTFNMMLYCLRDYRLERSWWGFLPGVTKIALREKLKTFNATFGEAHRAQARWEVPNLQLRETLHLSILEKLIPAYESFLERLSTHIKLGRFSTYIEGGKHRDTCFKYSVKDLETAVMNFFSGKLELI
uniref:Exocyst subunit Exo70 family protein n=1 Tax=Davidia involucrata TaxID=16924 RepID=A0A5B7BKI0_DAVIN